MPFEKATGRRYLEPDVINDRDYMREPDFRRGWPLAIWLVIANAAAFLAQSLGDMVFRARVPGGLSPVDALFALSLDGLRHGYVWQLLTFQFMHGGLLHLLLNCFVIYMFGRPLEEALGRRKFLTLYLAGGCVGGLVQMLAALVSERLFGGAVVGASAGAFALVAAYATLFPERPLTLLLFFVLPVTMRAKYLLVVSGVLAVLGLLAPGGVAHAAHLGGLLTGVAAIRWAGRWQWKPRRPGLFRRRPRLVTTLARGSASPAVSADERPPDELTPDEFLSKEVDPILDKISAHGIQSLTEREKRILEAARARMMGR